MNRQEQIELLAKEITSGTVAAVKNQIYKTKLMTLVFEEVHEKIVEKLNNSMIRRYQKRIHTTAKPLIQPLGKH